MITLVYNDYSASIHPKGAELQSLKKNGTEYLWEADPSFWGKHSPVLFPIVGQLKENRYIFKGDSYVLPRHGFAREMEFSAAQKSAAEAVFTLTETEATLNVYPFCFRLQLHYLLNEEGLHCSYIVTNTDEETLFFSVGGHPAFRCPLATDTIYEDWYLQFEGQEQPARWLLQDGLLSGVKNNLPFQENKLLLSPGLFYNDAIVLKGLKTERITLASASSSLGLHFTFREFPFFGIWAAKNAPFVCLEPWCGIADSLQHDLKLEHKEGINRLEPGQVWQRSWQVQPF